MTTSLLIPLDPPRRELASERQVIVGIRPEDMIFDPEGGLRIEAGSD